MDPENWTATVLRLKCLLSSAQNPVKVFSLAGLVGRGKYEVTGDWGEEDRDLGEKGRFCGRSALFEGIPGRGTPAVDVRSTVGGVASLQTDQSECQVGFEGEPPEGFGDIGRTASAENTDGEAPQGSHHSWTGAGPDLRGVFVEGHITDPMESVFYAPPAAVELEDSLGAIPSGGIG